MMLPCLSCKGAGLEDSLNGPVDCWECKGQGMYERPKLMIEAAADLSAAVANCVRPVVETFERVVIVLASRLSKTYERKENSK